MLDLQAPPKNGLPAMRLPPAALDRSASDWRPWLHAYAIVTMSVAVVAVISGSLVTTLRVGMEDPDWPTTPWHVFTTPWSQKSFGYLIEHMHRLADYLTGIFVIGLAVWTWLAERRTWVRWLGPLALVGVISQGVLGGLRILKDFSFGTELRIIHGCSAHVFIALLGVIVLVTSRGWQVTGNLSQSSKRVRTAAVVLLAALYVQITFGAVLRHTFYAPFAQRGHLLFAMASVAIATWLVLLLRSDGGHRPKKLVRALEVLLLLQVLLGVETWLKRFRNGPFVDLQPAGADFNSELVLRTLHLLVGSLLFATAAMIAVCTFRAALTGTSATSTGTTEGVA